MPQTAFRQLIASLTHQIAGRPLDATLDAWLNAEHGPPDAPSALPPRGRLQRPDKAGSAAST